MCESSDGVICDEVRVSESGGGGLSAGAIAAIVIIIVIFICVAGKSITILYNNNLYICCHGNSCTSNIDSALEVQE